MNKPNRLSYLNINSSRDAVFHPRSKALLFRYICSEHVRGLIGRNNVGGILNFLRGHVFVHEEYFASYKYNRHRSFLEYSNTPLEGTNGGLKYGYFAVQPHMKISTSASYMICQDELRHTEQKRNAHNNSCNTKLHNLNVEGSKETIRIVQHLAKCKSKSNSVERIVRYELTLLHGLSGQERMSVSIQVRD